MSEKPGPVVAAKPPALPTHEPLAGDNQEAQIKGLRLHKGKFDMYCPSCKERTTWTPIVREGLEARVRGERLSDRRSDVDWLEQFTLRIVCARIDGHVADFYFEVIRPNLREHLKRARDLKGLEPSNLLKVGQFPSLSDFQIGNLDEFKEGMNDQQRKEFVQAIHTSAHGFSVAACVYYRRVFENVLVEARDQHMAEKEMKTWLEFDRAKTDKRIKLLKARLPQFLSEHPHLYSVLSLGVHQLTEEQCAQELPMLREAIELIFHDRVDVIRKQKKRKALSRLLAQSVDRNKDR